VGLAAGLGVPNQTSVGSVEEMRSNGADREDADGISPSCPMAKRRSRAARNQ
jgi:hypothetical protein